MRVCENLEIHVAHACNLTCESCSHFSNQGHKGLLSIEEGEAWMAPWSRRLRPHVFSLLGGEPTLHPRLADWIVSARRYWPVTHLRLVTNGFLLHRHPGLPEALKRTDAHLYVSIHHDAPDYREKFAPVQTLLDGWVRDWGIPITYYPSFRTWTRRYEGAGAAMEPFADNRPRESWQICPAKPCKQLHQGALWKCAPLAYLGMQDAKYGLSEKWQPYLTYKPLPPGCSDAELDAFLARQDEPYCAMCPAFPRRISPHSPLPGQAGRPAGPRDTPGRMRQLTPAAEGAVHIVAIAAVKNEADIIEAFVRHTLAFVGRLVVLDNGSTDDTPAILRALCDEGLALEVVEDAGVGQFQSRRLTRLMRAHAHRADWVLPLDADEFVAGPSDDLVPADADPGRPLALPWHSYVPADSDDTEELNPVVRLRHRLVAGCKAQVVLVPARLAAMPGAVLPQGHHELEVAGQRVEPASGAAYLGHFPVRSPGQYLAKIAVNHLQYQAMPEREPEWGFHYREPFQRLKQDPRAFLKAYRAAAQSYLLLPGERADPQTVLDPFPYRGGALRYTRPCDDEHAGWRRLLEHAEALAFRLAVASARSAAAEPLAATAALVAQLRADVDRQVRLRQTCEAEKEQVIQRQLGDLQRLTKDLERCRAQLKGRHAEAERRGGLRRLFAFLLRLCT